MEEPPAGELPAEAELCCALLTGTLYVRGSTSLREKESLQKKKTLHYPYFSILMKKIHKVPNLSVLFVETFQGTFCHLCRAVGRKRF